MNEKEIEDKLFEGINAQMLMATPSLSAVLNRTWTPPPSVENPLHLNYPRSCFFALKVKIERVAFRVCDARHERRGYYFGLRVKMY